jgi:hypothetical protein
MCFATSWGEHCSDEQHQGPFRISDPVRNFPTVIDIVTTSKSIFIDGEAKLFTGYRSAWTSYCYNGGSMDGNTGCTSKLEHFPPSQEELVAWITTGKCRVGPDCQDCWGSDSVVCLNHDLSIDVKNGKELTRASNNNHFAYHTCNRSWRCGALESSIPLVLSWKQARRPRRQKRETTAKVQVCDPPQSCFTASYPDSEGNLRSLPSSDSLIKETKGESVYIRHNVKIRSEDMVCNCTTFKTAEKASLICSSTKWGVFEMDDCVHDMCFYNKGIIPDPTFVPANWHPASIDDVATVVRAV